MLNLVKIIEEFQKRIDLEKLQVLGIGLDRYAHFGIIFILSFLFFYFGLLKTAIFLSLFIIVLKEVIDFIPLFHYKDIRSEHLIDSTLDITMGLTAIYCAFLIYKLCLSKKIFAGKK